MGEEPARSDVDSPARLEDGLYLLKEARPRLSYRLFVRFLKEARPGLLISRRHPSRLEEDTLTKARHVWLSHTPGEDFHNPTALSGLNRLIGRFLQDNGRSIVLIDGLEYLLLHNDFPRTLLFLEYLNDLVIQHPAIVLLPINPEALEPKELALLDRNLAILQGGELWRDLEREEVLRLLDSY